MKAEFYNEEGVQIDNWFAKATDMEDGERVKLTISTTENERPADYELEASTSAF